MGSSLYLEKCIFRSGTTESQLPFSISLPVAANPPEVSAEGYADYIWEGPCGYPSGPENFSVHLSVHLTGGSAAATDVRGHDYGSGAAASSANVNVDVAMSCEQAEGGCELTGHANVSGSAGPGSSASSCDVEGDEDLCSTHIGDWTGDDPYIPNEPLDAGGFTSWALFGISLEEDYVLETAGARPELVIYAYFSVADGCEVDLLGTSPVADMYAYAYSYLDQGSGVNVTFGNTW